MMAEANQTDADYREHRATYESFLKMVKWGVVITALLVILALWALQYS